MAVDVRPLYGPDLSAALESLGQLRIRVFRAFPYLYDGDPAYEARYLAKYGEQPLGILAAAWDGSEIVGASTGMPLSCHDDAGALSLPDGAPAKDDIYYCAESVLLPEYRGHGVGHRFFDLRESFARDHGFGYTAFASVIRPPDHPARPADYRPLDAFWRGRGYEPLPGAVACFSWRDVGASEETRKELQLWLRPL